LHSISEAKLDENLEIIVRKAARLQSTGNGQGWKKNMNMC